MYMASVTNNLSLIKKLAMYLIFASLFLSLFIGLKNDQSLWSEYGALCGKIAVFLYITTLIPGILKRLNLASKIKDLYILLNALRRSIGILTFLFIWYHFLFLIGLGSILSGQIYTPSTLFEIFGLIAFQLLFLLFITSNDISVKKLGKWWGKIHSLTYIIIWLVMMHVSFVELSLAFLLGIFAFLEIYSILYKKFKGKYE